MTDSIRVLTVQIVAWADGALPHRRPESALKKFNKEVEELTADPTDGQEYADICIMLFDLADMHGIDIAEEIRKKLEVNKTRNWEEQDDGTFQHTTCPEYVRDVGEFDDWYAEGNRDAGAGTECVQFPSREAEIAYAAGRNFGLLELQDR